MPSLPLLAQHASARPDASTSASATAEKSFFNISPPLSQDDGQRRLRLHPDLSSDVDWGQRYIFASGKMMATG
jgi:hypothetical protein